MDRERIEQGADRCAKSQKAAGTSGRALPVGLRLVIPVSPLRPLILL